MQQGIRIWTFSNFASALRPSPEINWKYLLDHHPKADKIRVIIRGRRSWHSTLPVPRLPPNTVLPELLPHPQLVDLIEGVFQQEFPFLPSSLIKIATQSVLSLTITTRQLTHSNPPILNLQESHLYKTHFNNDYQRSFRSINNPQSYEKEQFLSIT